MSTKKEGANVALDWLLYFAASGLIGAFVWLNWLYATEPFLYRFGAGAAVLAISLYLLSRTSKGRRFVDFFLLARFELYKVVWPTRQETLQTVAIVLVVATLVGLMLWMFDGLFAWVVKLLLSLG